MGLQILTSEPQYFQIWNSTDSVNWNGMENLDNWNEVLEYVSKKENPRFVKIKHFNSRGHIGTAFKMYSTLKEQYSTYKKVSL